MPSTPAILVQLLEDTMLLGCLEQLERYFNRAQ